MPKLKKFEWANLSIQDEWAHTKPKKHKNKKKYARKKKYKDDWEDQNFSNY
jgi:hypothetical protein